MDISQLIGAFSTAGIFIWYLLNKEKTVTNVMMKKVDRLVESVDDLITVMFDVVDTVIPQYSSKINSINIKNRVNERKINEKD